VLFSIVTPSYNQAPYLRTTIESVLGQQVDLEYIVMDGGSNDGSREIIESYKDRLAYWQSEPDKGMYEAITRGFARSTGDIMGWVNSSDIYLPWTLPTVQQIFEEFPQIEWITSSMKLCITERNTYEEMWVSPFFSGRRFHRGLHGGPGNSDNIQQESCFWRRSLWEKIGSSIGRDRGEQAGDYWLWSRFFRQANPAVVEAPLAGFRFHEKAKSVDPRYQEDVALITREVQQEPECSYPDGLLNLTRHSDFKPDGSRTTYWKLEEREGSRYLNAHLTAEKIIGKLRAPLKRGLEVILPLAGI